MIKKTMPLALLHTTMGPKVPGTYMARLTYDGVHDPLAVDLTFIEPGSGIEVAWIVSRDLLITGADSPTYTGDGDIKVRVGYHGGRSVVLLAMEVPEGKCMVALPLTAVKSFLDATRQAVPTGGEMVAKELDEFLASLPADTTALDAQIREELEEGEGS